MSCLTKPSHYLENRVPEEQQRGEQVQPDEPMVIGPANQLEDVVRLAAKAMVIADSGHTGDGGLRWFAELASDQDVVLGTCQ